MRGTGSSHATGIVLSVFWCEHLPVGTIDTLWTEGCSGLGGSASLQEVMVKVSFQLDNDAPVLLLLVVYFSGWDASPSTYVWCLVCAAQMKLPSEWQRSEAETLR